MGKTRKNMEKEMDQEDTITITREELDTFIKDVAQGYGIWSDTSYRICRFVGIDPSDGT